LVELIIMPAPEIADVPGSSYRRRPRLIRFFNGVVQSNGKKKRTFAPPFVLHRGFDFRLYPADRIRILGQNLKVRVQSLGESPIHRGVANEAREKSKWTRNKGWQLADKYF
jgi:hypothetical protein